MASKSSTKSSRKYIKCLITVLPPNVLTFEDFIEVIAINCFPEEILPVKKDRETNEILTNSDGKFVIVQTPDTINLVDLKTIKTQQYGDKINITINVPIPRETDLFYEYMMENLINPLMYSDESRPLAELDWIDENNGQRRFVKLSLVTTVKKIPPQDRFRRRE